MRKRGLHNGRRTILRTPLRYEHGVKKCELRCDGFAHMSFHWSLFLVKSTMDDTNLFVVKNCLQTLYRLVYVKSLLGQKELQILFTNL